MKASHNTFSYLRANIFLEIISPWWRCQNLNAKEQKVDMIDTRVSIKDGEHALLKVNLNERQQPDQHGNTHYLKANCKKSAQKEGEYYYAPRGRQYAIMQRHYVGDICMDDKVECCNTRFRARERVYELNGWRK